MCHSLQRIPGGGRGLNSPDAGLVMVCPEVGVACCELLVSCALAIRIPERRNRLARAEFIIIFIIFIIIVLFYSVF